MDYRLRGKSSAGEYTPEIREHRRACLLYTSVIASVSCIYGLGSPEDYLGMMVSLRPGMEKDRDEVILSLIHI